MAKMHFLVYLFLLANVVLRNKTAADDLSTNTINSGETKLVAVVFRHADRAPDPVEIFPRDPNFRNDYYPEGLGGLTIAGKRREFGLGEELRRKYGNFLGTTVHPGTVYARSTDYPRTKMCLQLVLSALYPPVGKQVWNERLPWQPIPMNYVTSAQDWLMIPEECPEYLRERRMAVNIPKLRSKIESFQGFMKNLTILTGKNIATPNDMYNLYHLFVAETAMNLTLADWVPDVFPSGLLFDGIQLEYEIFSYTQKMRRLNGGKLLKQIIDEMKKVEFGIMDKNRKINLYSGHETNVAALLQTLGLFTPHVPEYSSAVVLELVYLNNEHFVKILHRRGIPANTWEIKKIDGCDWLCPIDKFTHLLKDVIPFSSEMECDKSIVL